GRAGRGHAGGAAGPRGGGHGHGDDRRRPARAHRMVVAAGAAAPVASAPTNTKGGWSVEDPLLAADAVSLRFGGVRALSDVSFEGRRGELITIIGPNGAGKTSMQNCISALYRPTEGRIRFGGQDITDVRVSRRAALGIGRKFQNLA